MKKECLICNEMFEALNGAKFSPKCRAEGRRICTRCGAVFRAKGRTRTCNACNTACMREGKKEYAPRENVERYVPKDQKMLDEKASAAQRGLLRV